MNQIGGVILQIDRLLEDYPELQDDDLLRLDTIEGETDALDIANRLARLYRHAEIMQDAIKSERAALANRQARYGNQADGAKAALHTLLQAMDQRKLELPAATVSLRAGSESVEVSDVDELPQGYFKTSRTADKAAIKAAIKGGDAIPGATLQRSPETVSVRVL